MDAPVSSDIRDWSKLDFGDPDLGYPAPSGSGSDPLDFVVAQAIAYIWSVTARPLDSTMPAMLEPIAQAAVTRRVEQIVEATKGETIDTVADIDLVASFSAGSYSETRKDTTNRLSGPVNLNPWPELDRMLWLMLSDTPAEAAAGGVTAVSERRDYWRYMCGLQPNAPAWQLVEVDWSRGLDYASSSISPFEPWSRYI